jgi:hypothetical protein
MNKIKPIIFLLPIIILLVSSILFYFLLKKAADKQVFKQYIFTVIVVSFMLNLAWELIQLPLYRNAVYNFEHIAFCTLAAIADVLMTLIFYLLLAVILKDVFWIQLTKLHLVAIVVLIGGVGAVLSEIRHLSLGSWAYDDSMPLIPYVNVGISPVLQFMLLPLIIYKLSYYFQKIKLVQ